MHDQEIANTFTNRLEIVHQHANVLSETAQKVSWDYPQLVLSCLEELRVALEELHVAEEELTLQNEELVKTRQTIEKERQRYQELFEFAPDGYLVTDTYGTIQEANRAAAQLLSRDQRYLIRKPFVNFVPEVDRRAFRTMLSQLPTIHRLDEWEVTLQRRDGSCFEAALTVEAVRNRAGQLTSLRWLLRDITIRKQTEAQLRQVQLQNLELIEVDRLKSQFATTLSHELRTPLNAILGFAHILQRQLRSHLESHQLHMLERMIHNGHHLLTLIEEMLDFSRLRANRLQLQVEPFNLTALAATTLEELQSLALQKGLKLEANLPAGELVVINDRHRLRQVLANLLANAIKFTQCGSVTLEVMLFEERVVLTVRDTGIGINPAVQNQIFQEFWQVDQSRSRAQGGTGLGLSITRSLVHLMQGSISVESEEGEGATFRVELPRHVRAS